MLSIARLSCGLPLRELGARTDMTFDAVSKAVARVNRRMSADKEPKELYETVASKLEKPV